MMQVTLTVLGVIFGGVGGIFYAPLILRINNMWSNSRFDRLVICAISAVAGALVCCIGAWFFGEQSPWMFSLVVVLSGLTAPVLTAGAGHAVGLFKMLVGLSDRVAKRVLSQNSSEPDPDLEFLGKS